MINVFNAVRYCKDDISLIENYEQAVNDTTQTWECHHRDEIRELPSGMIVRRSIEELVMCGRYYNCPANELILLTKSEHMRLHMTNSTCSEQTKAKLSKRFKGRIISAEQRAKLSKALSGKHKSYEHRHKLREAAITNNFGKANKGKTYTEFGRKFKDKYNITSSDNLKLYKKEYHYYRTHNKCSWE